PRSFLSLHLLNAGHVQLQGRHAFVAVFQSAARSRINPLRRWSKRLIRERPTDAAVGAGDQDCLLLKVHTVLLSNHYLEVLKSTFLLLDCRKDASRRGSPCSG